MLKTSDEPDVHGVFVKDDGTEYFHLRDYNSEDAYITTTAFTEVAR